MAGVRPPRAGVKSASQWVVDLESFVAGHDRLPNGAARAESGLYQWMNRHRRDGGEALPAYLRDRFNTAIAAGKAGLRRAAGQRREHAAQRRAQTAAAAALEKTRRHREETLRRLTALESFVAEHGRRPQQNNDDEQQLYQWLFRFRRGVVAVPEDLQPRVDALAVVPTQDRLDAARAAWQRRAQQRLGVLEAFAATNARLPGSNGAGDEPSLYRWMMKHWRARSLPEGLLDRLDKLLADTPRTADIEAQWMLAELEKFIAARGRLPAFAEGGAANRSLRQWVNRYQAGQALPEQVRVRLDELLASTPTPEQHLVAERRDQAERPLRELEAFVAERGRLPQPVPGEIDLYRWLRRGVDAPD